MLYNKSIKIRDAVLSDIEAIRELCRESKAYWGYDDDFMTKFMNQYHITAENIRNNTFKLFFDFERLVGFYAFAMNKNEAIPLSLEDFFIHPDYIGQGIGKMMWLNCIDFVKSIGKDEFILESDPNAADFYKKMGCIQVRTRESPIMKNRFVPILKYKIDRSIDTPLPLSFETQIINTFGERGIEWLKRLPESIKYASNKWQLDNLQTMSNLSFNYVASGFSKLFNVNIILKILLDNNEFSNEKLGLVYFQGRCINKLLANDDAHNILLLEKIGTGVTLKSLFPHRDNEAIEIAANIIEKFHRKTICDLQIKDSYPTITEWAKILDKFSDYHVPQKYVSLGQELADDLCAQEKYPHEYLLHGDLHHENILHSHNDEWVSIDPKGVIGNIAYEIGAFMRNPVHELVIQPNLEQILVNRINKFSELLSLDRQLLVKYSYLVTLLGIIWSFEDKGDCWQDWLKLLPIFESMLQMGAT